MVGQVGPAVHTAVSAVAVVQIGLECLGLCESDHLARSRQGLRTYRGGEKYLHGAPLNSTLFWGCCSFTPTRTPCRRGAPVVLLTRSLQNVLARERTSYRLLDP